MIRLSVMPGLDRLDPGISQRRGAPWIAALAQQ